MFSFLLTKMFTSIKVWYCFQLKGDLYCPSIKLLWTGEIQIEKIIIKIKVAEAEILSVLGDGSNTKTQDSIFPIMQLGSVFRLSLPAKHPLTSSFKYRLSFIQLVYSIQSQAEITMMKSQCHLNFCFQETSSRATGDTDNCYHRHTMTSERIFDFYNWWIAPLILGYSEP